MRICGVLSCGLLQSLIGLPMERNALRHSGTLVGRSCRLGVCPARFNGLDWLPSYCGIFRLVCLLLLPNPEWLA